jgi:ankyrin repeat protein
MNEEKEKEFFSKSNLGRVLIELRYENEELREAIRNNIMMSQLDAVLYDACLKRSIKDVRDLIAEGANVNAKHSHYGERPLHIVARLDRPRVAELLIKAGANVNALDMYYQNALSIAVQNDSWYTMKILLQYGADVKYGRKDDETPLDIAIDKEYIEAAKELIKAEAAQTKDMTSLNEKLCRVCGLGYLEIAKALIEVGADVNFKAKYGTPLSNAIEEKQFEIVKLLKEHGAKE